MRRVVPYQVSQRSQHHVPDYIQKLTDLSDPKRCHASQRIRRPHRRSQQTKHVRRFQICQGCSTDHHRHCVSADECFCYLSRLTLPTGSRGDAAYPLLDWHSRSIQVPCSKNMSTSSKTDGTQEQLPNQSCTHLSTMVGWTQAKIRSRLWSTSTCGFFCR